MLFNSDSTEKWNCNHISVLESQLCEPNNVTMTIILYKCINQMRYDVELELEL